MATRHSPGGLDTERTRRIETFVSLQGCAWLFGHWFPVRPGGNRHRSGSARQGSRLTRQQQSGWARLRP